MVSAIDLAKRALVTFLETLAAAFKDFKKFRKSVLQTKGRGLILASDAAQRVIRC